MFSALFFYVLFSLLIIKKIIQQLHNKTMKSLTTQDILGAKPRIRHPPRNLIRDQKLNQQNGNSFSYSNSTALHPEMGSQPHYPYNYQYPYNNQQNPQNYQNQNYQQSRYQNQDQNFANQESQHQGNYNQPINNVNMSKSSYYNPNSPHAAGRTSNRINDSIKLIDRYEQQKGGRRYIMPKDAPVVNYDQVKYVRKQPPTTTYERNFNAQHRQVYEKNIHNLNMSRQFPKPSAFPVDPNTSGQQSSNQKYYLQKPRSHSSLNSAQSRYNNNNSVQKQKQNEQKNKNIFRGLGYNIISNSKYQYDMENRYLNSTSKWLN